MRIRTLVAVVLMPFLSSPRTGLAEIISDTSYKLDLSKPKEAAKKANWSDPDKIEATSEGLGWGGSDDKGSRDVWVKTKPIALGLSWRPTMIATVKAKVTGDGADGLL